MKTKIKICGLTKTEEVKMLVDNAVDYAGIVMFYEKSKRNNSISNAADILKELKKNNIKSVAVVVSPDAEQIKIIEKMGFDYIQIHGKYNIDNRINIKVFRGLNVDNFNEYEKECENHNIEGFVFDSKESGSGKTFDWKLLDNINRRDKLVILAGGLNIDNVAEAIEKVRPDIVDVSSAVEGEHGKDLYKIRGFVKEVRKGAI